MGNNPYEDMINNPDAAVPPPPAARGYAAPPTAGRNVYEDMIGQPAPPKPPQRRPEEMRNAELNWRQTIDSKLQDAFIAMGADPYMAGKTARGFMDAASLFPPIGGTISALDTGYYATHGDPIMAGVNALGMIPGGTAARRAIGGMPQRMLAPSEAELAASKTASYDAWRQAPITYSPDAMTEAVNHIRQTMVQSGADPALKEGALNIGLGMRRQTGMNNNDFELLRRHLDGGSTGSERYAGQIAKSALEDYVANHSTQHVRTGTPADIAAARANLLNARGSAAAEFRSNVISGKENIADIAEERGGDFGNTFRNRMGTLSNESPASERALRGFNQDERDRIRDEVAGSLLEKATGGFGSALDRGATKVGVGIGGAAGAAPWLTGGAIGLDPITATAVAGGIAGGGKVIGKGLEGYSTDLAKQSARELGEAVRMRSPMAQAPGSPYGTITDPAAMANDARKYLMYPWARQEGEDYVEGERVPFENR